MFNNRVSKRFAWKILVVGFTFCGLLFPLALRADEDDHDIETHDPHAEFVQLSEDEIKEFGIEIAEAGPGNLDITIVVPGEVAVNYDQLAHIAPRFPGVVTAVSKHLGEKVVSGDVLAIIESNEGLVPYEIKSYIDGTVLEKHITVGEAHSGEDVPSFVIANLDTVWVNLSIYQMHLPYVAIGQKAVISAGEGIQNAKGVISYLSPSVDEHTRTLTARVVLPNHDGRWRPGLFIEGRITVEEEKVPLLVPKSALQTMEDQTVVFIRSNGGFKPQPVEIGRTNGTSVEVTSGLTPGQYYVSKGGFALKAELLKAGFSGGHGH